MAAPSTAIDPLGNTVYLLPEVHFSQNDEKGIYDDVTKVISKPAALIEVIENGETHYFYLRSVGWNRSLLVVSRFKNDRWEAFRLVQNPPTDLMSALLKKGKQVL